MRGLLLPCCVAILSLTPQTGWAEDSKPETDKSDYNLFNPTPEKAMRVFDPERPGKVTNPYTVDAGHVQIESDVVSYTHSNNGVAGTRTFETADPVVKLGLTNSIDFELAFNGYNNFTTHDNAAGTLVANGHGFSDLYIRSKINLLGNDKGDMALAIVPYVKAPTATPALGNGLVEGGMLVPLQINLPADFTLILMTEFDALKRAADSKRYANFINIASVAHALPFISKDLSVTVEYFAQLGTDPATRPVYTFDLGLAYLLNPSLQVDVGANFGLNKAAPNLNVYAGISTRF